MKISELQKYKKILILGYAKEGAATEQVLKKYLPDTEIGIADTKEENYLEKQYKYDFVIKHQAVHKSLVKVPYTTAANIFFGNVPNKIIGVTGSKGKSTTVSLIYDILKAGGFKTMLLGNIGTPMISALLEPIDKETVFVLELSSYQLEDLQYSPHISVVTSLFPEHMNYHGSVEKYYEAKHTIIAHATENDYFVYNPQFELLKKWAQSSKAKTVPFIDKLPFSIDDLPLKGEHMLSNLKGAVTVSKICSIPDKVIENAVRSFQPLRHRMQFVGTFKGIFFYDDAISTTPESTIPAIEALKNVKTIFLGGLNRGYDFTSLIPVLKEYNIQNIVLFPESGADIKQLVQQEEEYRPKLFETSDMKAAVQFAYETTPQDSVVLLSTASPSYTIWKNFEEKGDLFQKYVKELGME
jgi:UDP-N-acetylmuramoylalanine--D-glutamate ligase